MDVKGPLPNLRLEPRWPVALAIVSVFVMLALLPERVRWVSRGIPLLIGIVTLLPIAGVRLAAGRAPWPHLERAVTVLSFLLMEVGTIATLGHLIRLMVRRPEEIGGLSLLSSSIGVWIINVLAFSLLYWQLDRGGPEARANHTGLRPDWQFTQSGAAEDAPPGWGPTYVDYLFLGFTTATAFSPTDALPMTSRAKLLMMLESALSLVTIVVVASRAINILGN